jgi:hypothetical protein
MDGEANRSIKDRDRKGRSSCVGNGNTSDSYNAEAPNAVVKLSVVSVNLSSITSVHYLPICPIFL